MLGHSVSFPHCCCLNGRLQVNSEFQLAYLLINLNDLQMSLILTRVLDTKLFHYFGTYYRTGLHHYCGSQSTKNRHYFWTVDLDPLEYLNQKSLDYLKRSMSDNYRRLPLKLDNWLFLFAAGLAAEAYKALWFDAELWLFCEVVSRIKSFKFEFLRSS